MKYKPGEIIIDEGHLSNDIYLIIDVNATHYVVSFRVWGPIKVAVWLVDANFKPYSTMFIYDDL